MTLQIEGVAHVIKQLTDLQQTPNLDSPHYIVLKKTKEYEVRQYSPYLVAETSMPSGTRPAGGDGFNNLAGYIFGGNSRSTYHWPATRFTLCFAYCIADAHMLSSPLHSLCIELHLLLSIYAYQYSRCNPWVDALPQASL